MKRILYIVSRDQPQLVARFKRAFAGEEHVEVILDRRRSQRRQSFEIPDVERRHRIRRWRDISKSLKAMGWAVVYQPLTGAGGSSASPGLEATPALRTRRS